MTILVGARSPQDMLYHDELETWRGELDVVVTVDHADPAWRGNVGVVTALIGAPLFLWLILTRRGALAGDA